MNEPLFVFGASGHAKVVVDAARRGGHAVIAVFDDDAATHGESLQGVPVIGGRAAFADWRAGHPDVPGVVAIGVNAVRQRVAEWLGGQGVSFARVIHPRAVLAEDVAVAAGCVLMAGAIVNSGARLGAQCIVNTGASIDHDCELDVAVHVAPGSVLCGNVRVGARTLVGAGSTVIPGIRIGADVVVGAGSTVIRDLDAGQTVAGAPTRRLS